MNDIMENFDLIFYVFQNPRIILCKHLCSELGSSYNNAIRREILISYTCIYVFMYEKNVVPYTKERYFSDCLSNECL